MLCLFSQGVLGPGKAIGRQQDQVSGPSDLGPSQQLPESWPHAWGVSEILGQLSGLCPGSLGLFLHSPKGVHVLQNQEGMKESPRAT